MEETPHETCLPSFEPAEMRTEELLAFAQSRLEAGALDEALLLYQQLAVRNPGEPWLSELMRQVECQQHTESAELRFPGARYLAWLKWFHGVLRPSTYVEIGVESGASLHFAKWPTRAIGIDPALQVVHSLETWVKLFKLPSDAFFAHHDLRRVLEAPTVDLAFIDGLHTFDQALMDFINLERYAGPDTVVLFHDVFPLSAATAARDRQTLFWTGDTWKVMLILKELRPDLGIFTIPTYPSGLGVVTGLNPNSTVLPESLAEITQHWMSVDLEAYLDEMPRHVNAVNNDVETVASHLRDAGVSFSN